MEAREAGSEFQKGRLSVAQLLDLLDNQQRTIHRLQAELARVKARLAQYEPEIQHETSPANGSLEQVPTVLRSR